MLRDKDGLAMLIVVNESHTTAKTNEPLMTPAAGSFFVVTDIIVSTGGSTDGTIKLLDGVDGSVVFIQEVKPATYGPQRFHDRFAFPFMSSTAGNSLVLTTTAAITVHVQLRGYYV